MFLPRLSLTLLLLFAPLGNAASPRNVIIKDGKWTNTKTGEVIRLDGANVVMKGDPWIPAVEGSTVCDTSDVDQQTSCATFNEFDIKNLKGLGYNMIRLGVVWAGAQPDGPFTELSSTLLERLDAVLDLAEEHDLQVLIDLHQDAVGTAVCGEGVPMWFSQLAIPNQIGKPLWPLPKLDDGTCGRNDTETWAEYAGDNDYNIKNLCCRKLNGGNWGQVG
mmetsp:Transcript_26035/g.49141  ORF Transcript_26035/g.49141 Transcript_26035/m.49141 type:complete len:219 (+) Transcript_26035:135-791(+)